MTIKEEIQKIENESELDDLLTEIYKKKRQSQNWVWGWVSQTTKKED